MGIRRVQGSGQALGSILPVIAGPGVHLPSNGIPLLGPLGWAEAGLTELGHCPQPLEWGEEGLGCSGGCRESSSGFFSPQIHCVREFTLRC